MAQRPLRGKDRTRRYRSLVRRYGERCVFCGAEDELTIDHIHPLSRGGTNKLSNLQLLCLSCNQEKANRVLTTPQREDPLPKARA